MTNSQRMKTRFRRTARWLRFRKMLKKEQRTDPVTGAALHNKQQRDYDEYCDCCYEYGITPMSLEDYLGQD